MRLNHEGLLQIVYDSLDELSEMSDGKYSFEKYEEEAIFGKAGKLDSLDLVNLLVIIEERLENIYGISITIANERAISERHSPFANVIRLVEFISREVNIV
ncbi:MAG TPA: hypothetical protein PK916_09780 [Bacteroidota bacterium]|nr:hypothetical protein [Bacteroidota bacterium]